MNDKINAINYAAQAVKSLIDGANRNKKTLPNDSNFIISLANQIIESQHFVMPNNGKLLADGCKGLMGEEIRLPYPSITVECFMDQNDAEMDDNHFAVTKRLVVAVDLKKITSGFDLSLIMNLNFNLGLDISTDLIIDGIFMLPIACVENRWMPHLFAVIVNRNWDNLVPSIDPDKGDGVSFTGTPILVLPELLERMGGSDEVKKLELAKSLMQDAIDDIPLVLELLEALTCQNIKSVIFQEASPANHKREKAGKIPIWETKVLAVNVTHDKTTVSSGKTIKGRKSPSQHLRRGHIRRLSNGIKIWINNTIVASKNYNIINKIYNIK